MKFNVDWLKEWVRVDQDDESFSHCLTMAGLEVESIERVAPGCPAIVGRIESVNPHPAADNLRVCSVGIGNGPPIDVVCGAPNARPGLLVPYVPVGSVLPNGSNIELIEIRGVRSHGMLCSAAEIAIGDDESGLLELGSDAVPGSPLVEYLRLDDAVIELGLTPNRGDCLSIIGLAREYSALSAQPLPSVHVAPVQSNGEATLAIALAEPDRCTRYAARIIRAVNTTEPTPLWLKERLRRCGIRSISVVVDITNYVMLELGQPMHAYDLRQVQGCIKVRRATEGEELALLDGTTIALSEDALLIADSRGPLALAGIMGGHDSGVTDTTVDIVLESAFFEPIALSRTARRYALHTDAAHRFERGVDPSGQSRAIERATSLILASCGGTPEPVVDIYSAQHRFERPTISFRPGRVAEVLGMEPGWATAREVFSKLGMGCDATGDVWTVSPPPWRSDLSNEVDLIEEIARLVGYEALPETRPEGTLRLATSQRRQDLRLARQIMVGRGYFEAVTFSFIATQMHDEFAPDLPPLLLANPIAADMATMRPSLLPGLLNAIRFNCNRQQQDLRLFEYGMTFRQQGNELIQNSCLAAMLSGEVLESQWGAEAVIADYFDIKQDLSVVLNALGCSGLRFEKAAVPGFHPGQCAQVFERGEVVATIGSIHPKLLKKLDITQPVLAFEVYWTRLPESLLTDFRPLSRFPSVRRDLALIVAEGVTAQALIDTVTRASDDTLRDLQLFDVYRGQGIDSGKKSLALGLIFQAAYSTLTEQEIDEMVARVVEAVRRDLDGELRT